MPNPPNTTLNIRQAIEADVPLILSFIKGLAEYERLAHEVVTDEETLRNSLFGDRAYAEVLFAELEEPVGFAIFFHSFSTFIGKPGIYLEDLFIKPEARGKGVGKALMEHLAKLALERGCARFEWAVLNWNDPAIEFYRRIGAKPMTEWTVQRVTGEALSALAGEP